MWILAGSRTRVRPVADGRVVRRRCDACDAVTDWAECDMLDRIELFGVSLLDTRSRRFVCGGCGDDLHPDDVGPSAPRRASPPADPAARPAGSPARPAGSAARPAGSAARPAGSAARPGTPPHDVPARSARDVAWISSRHVGPHHPEIDEEIAAIKRRLGKG